MGEEEYVSLTVSQPEPSPMKPAVGRKRRMDESDPSDQPSKRTRVKEEAMEGEEDLLTQYQTAELPDPPPPAQTGVLSGQTVSVSGHFSPSDQQVACKVIRTHGGRSAKVAE